MTTQIPSLFFTGVLSLTLPLLQTYAADPCIDKPGADKMEGAALKLVCEHKILTYTCDECRYETGVVKLAPALLAPTDNTPPLVQRGAATRQKVEHGLETVGEIRLNEHTTIRISSPISGLLRTVKGDSGTVVKPGDILAEVESATLEEAIGTYVKSRTLTEAAQRHYQREKNLAEQKVSAQVEADEARSRYDNALADREAATHTLKTMGLSEAELATLTGAAPCLLPLRAPHGGTLIEKHVAAGNRIQPDQSIMTISDLTSIWVWLDLYERDLAPVLEALAKQKLTVTIETRAFPGRRFKGTLETLGATMDETTRTVKARALVPNPDGLLRPGMFCKANLNWTGSETVLAVPRQAVLEDEGQTFVFTHLKDDYYIRTPIKKGREFSDSTEILEGLSEGAPVVAEGAFLLKSDVLREKMGAGCAD